MPSDKSLEEDYDYFPRIEAEFQAFLDESLGPRGPDFLYEVVAGLGFSAGARVLDLGCGEGQHSRRLAEEFGFRVTGIDPVARNLQVANDGLADVGEEVRQRVRFKAGQAEAIPLPDASVDLIWCKEVLVLIEALEPVFAECRRVLRPDGRMLIYHVSATEKMEPMEARWFPGAVPPAERKERFEAAFASAGLAIDQYIELGSEGGEYAQETSGEPGRRLVHAARLLRDPERYIARFGRNVYDIMLGDCFWHIYRMIGKLSARVYVLRPTASRGAVYSLTFA